MTDNNDPLVTIIKDNLRSARRSGKPWTIFRVPPGLSDAQKNSFSPKLISIGPYHNATPRQDPMFDLKMSHLLNLLKYQMEDLNVENLVEAMRTLEPKARECYFNLPTDITSDDFVFMLVLDGCFIIDLLLMYHGEYPLGPSDSSSSNSRILKTRWLLSYLQRDLMKLENQIPFFVLEELFLLTKPSTEPPKLNDLLLHFFEVIYRFERAGSRSDCEHPLDLLRSFVLDSVLQHRRPRDYDPSGSLQLIFSAQQLQEAGVLLKVRKFFHLLDIEYCNRYLNVPRLCLDENMTTMLLNFVAYEQCNESIEPHFTNYFLFLDSLINTTKDVEILHKNEILKYPLGTEKEVVDLFNNFCKEMLYDLDQEYLSVNMSAVNKYCSDFYDSECRFWLSKLKKERFSSPWTFLSLVAAIVLLVLTLLQTIYTMVSYYHPI